MTQLGSGVARGREGGGAKAAAAFATGSARGPVSLRRLAVPLFAAALLAVPAEAKTPPSTFADLAEQLLPAVVNISTTQTISGRIGPEQFQLPPGSPFEEFFKEFFNRDQPQRRQKATSLGSGFVIDPTGYVVTNNHVIQDAEEISVILADDTRLEAEVVGRDAKTDIAVLKVKSSRPLPAVRWGDSDTMRVGDWVIAIGNPFGLGGTVTAGIISARGRDIQAGPYDDFMQTDASINRGNSGGPMFNLEGEVVGINTAIFSPSGGSVGIGFAIPSATAKPVISQLIKTGHVRRGWLGVHIQTVTEEIAETLGLQEIRGALVASVIDGGPAQEGKIEAGDVILEFNGRPINEMRRLPRIVAETEVGSSVPVVVWRNGQRVTVRVAVGELEEGEKQVAATTGGEEISPEGDVKVAPLGLSLATVTDKLREQYDLAPEANGVVVTAVDPNGPAAEKNIRPGDLVVEVSQEEVKDPSRVVDLVETARKTGRRSVLLLLEGQGRLRFEALRLAG